jgi:hypothetical protein
VDRFVANTNIFAATQTSYAWAPANNVNREEMKKYFGHCLYMGIVQLPEHSMYWNKDNYGQDL